MTFHIPSSLACGPVALTVANLARSRAFYEGLLGLKVRASSDKHLEIGTAQRTLFVLEENASALRRPRGSTGLYHAAILLPSRADLGAMLARLIDVRYRIGASDHLVSEALYLSDPDGNGLEIYRDRSRSEWPTLPNGQITMDTLPLDAEGLLAERYDAAAWHRMPDDTIIGHVHLQVTELDSVKAFYVDLLGLDLMTTYPGALFVAAGGYHHHLGLNIWESAGGKPAPAGSIGLQWYTLTLPDTAALEAVKARLDHADQRYSAGDDGALFLADPAGNTLRLAVG